MTSGTDIVCTFGSNGCTTDSAISLDLNEELNLTFDVREMVKAAAMIRFYSRRVGGGTADLMTRAARTIERCIDKAHDDFLPVDKCEALK